jgi:hypothetical protein
MTNSKEFSDKEAQARFEASPSLMVRQTLANRTLDDSDYALPIIEA